MTAAKKLVATETFASEVKGEQVLVHAGEVLPASSPLVKANPDRFEDPSSRRKPSK
jgi:hypothetical protein